MNELLQAAAEVAGCLDELDIAYAVIGGLAVQYWGEPRTTRDVDLTVLIPEERLDRVLQVLLERFTPRIEGALAFARQNRVLLLQTAAAIPIDLSLCIPVYVEFVMERAVAIAAGSTTLRIISAEDLIVHKCVAGRPRDVEDVERILVRQRGRLDLDYIGSWLAEFNSLVDSHDVLRLFEQARSKADDERPAEPRE